MNANEGVVVVVDSDSDDQEIGNARRRAPSVVAVDGDSQQPPSSPPPPPPPRSPSFRLTDLSNDLIVSIFALTNSHYWVRTTMPRVCRDFAELYRTRHASPLHAVLKVDAGAVRGDASRVLEWANAHALDIKKLRVSDRRQLRGEEAAERELRGRGLEHHLPRTARAGAAAGAAAAARPSSSSSSSSSSPFTAETLGALVRALSGGSIEEVAVAGGCERLVDRRFWEALVAGDAVAVAVADDDEAAAATTTTTTPSPRLRSLVVRSIGEVDPDRHLKPLALSYSGTLEELVLCSGTRSANVLGEGGFPEQLLALTSLKRLELSRHLLLSSIPDSISNLRKLEEFRVKECRLSALPESLTTLKKITRLDFGGNGLLGAPRPEAAAAAAIGGGRGGGGAAAAPPPPPPPPFPEALRRLTRLRHLGLRSCGLSAVPDFVSQLEALRSLSLGGSNRLGSLPPMLSLTRLDLSSSSRLAALPRGISALQGLRELDASSCSLASLSSRELGALTNLTKLELSGNAALGPSLLAPRRRSSSEGAAAGAAGAAAGAAGAAAGAGAGAALPAATARVPSLRPSTFRGLVSLRRLDLRRCGLRAVPSRALRGLSSLKFLDLSHNAIGGSGRGSRYGAPLRSDDGDDAPFPPLPCLRRLDLSDCDLSSLPSATALGLAMPRLWFLYLHKNVLNDLPMNLGRSLRELRGVLLSGNSYRRVPVDALAGATALDSINLDNNFPLQVEQQEGGGGERSSSSSSSSSSLDAAFDAFPWLRSLSLLKTDSRSSLPQFQLTEASRRNLEAFAARLQAREPSARVAF